MLSDKTTPFFVPARNVVRSCEKCWLGNGGWIEPGPCPSVQEKCAQLRPDPGGDAEMDGRKHEGEPEEKRIVAFAQANDQRHHQDGKEITGEAGAIKEPAHGRSEGDGQ